MRSPDRALLCVTLALLAGTACSSTEAVAPIRTLAPTSGAPSSASLFPLDLFGIGPSHGNPCTATGYRQFDFWVGNWDVYKGTSSDLAGTNQVKAKLGGCAVEENWIGAQGGLGRSLNTYDHARGTWTQLWVGAGGCMFSVILVEGAFVDGSMTMIGRREFPGGIAGACLPPGVAVTSRTDRIRWTPLSSDVVFHELVGVNDDAPLPPLPQPGTAGLRYQRVPTVTALPAISGGSFCPFRLGAQQFNFVLGSWDVHRGNGQGVQGSATYAKDVTSCLLEETVAGSGGYAGMSFSTFDVFTQQWIRLYVDTDGQTLLLRGGVDDGRVVLTGSKLAQSGATILVRITWTPENADAFTQRWEFSHDGGASWQTGQTLRYTRRV